MASPVGTKRHRNHPAETAMSSADDGQKKTPEAFASGVLGYLAVAGV